MSSSTIVGEVLSFDKRRPFDIGTKSRRRLISMYFLQSLDAPPPSEWHGQDGTISNIIRDLHLNCHRDTVHRVLVETNLALQQGHRYLGEISADRG